MITSAKFILSIAASIALLIAAGCGSSDPRSNDLTGSVSFEGKPVPAGVIRLEPAAGNSGPAGLAEIKDGVYDTSAAGQTGTVGGPHKIIISGYDGNADPTAELPMGKLLFTETVEFDIPQGVKTTKDFTFTK